MNPRILLSILSLLFLSFYGRVLGESTAAPLYTLAGNAKTLATDERVVGFEIKVTAGAFESLKALPPAWTINIENLESWDATCIGSVLVGSAAISESEVLALATIVAEPGSKAPPVVEVTIHATKNFADVKKYKLAGVTLAPLKSGKTEKK